MRRFVVVLVLAIALLASCRGDAGPLRLRGYATATGAPAELRTITLTGHGSHLRVRVELDPAWQTNGIQLWMRSDSPGYTRSAFLLLAGAPSRFDTVVVRPIARSSGAATFDIPVSMLGHLRVPFTFGAISLRGSFPGN